MLLTTKFLRPSSDPRAVPRDRLRSWLETSGANRLTLVVAPAGFGKTTLVSQWCATTSDTTAWLSLDEHDNEPRRFWQYVTGAFEYAGLPGMAECHRILNRQSGDDMTAVITAIINELARDNADWTLVLDDYHCIDHDAIHRQIAWFLDYLPPGKRLTLASRTEPHLPLNRWRVRRWVEDIHPGLLAFSEDECLAFFRTTMGVDLSDDEARAICRKTEGWVAAMQLSALSGGRAPMPGAREAGRWDIDERQISDYVLTEVLSLQPPETTDFLLDTACCPRLTASLCDTLREREDSQAMLEELLRQNLFLIPLDNRNEWFRYHDLFRDALRQRLAQTDPERADRLWRITVTWLLGHGHVQEAIAQIVRQQDWPWLAQVLAEHGNNLIHGGFHLPVLEWLDALPDDLVRQSPQLQMLRVWGLFFANRVDSLEPLLLSLEDLLDRRVADSHPDAEGALGLNSEIALVRSYLARTRSDDKRANDLTRQVLEDIDHTRIPLKSVTYYGLGLDGYGEGDLPGAVEALRAAVHYGQVERKPSTALSSGGLLAWIQYHRGQIDAALQTCTDVRQWVDQHYADPSQPRLISCWQNAALTEICRERNELPLAHSHLAPLLEHVRRGTEPGQHVIIQHVAGHLAFSEGLWNEAIDALEDARQVARKRREHILFEPPLSAALLARCYLAIDDVERASACLDQESLEAIANPLHREQYHLARARVLNAQDQPRAALESLMPLRSDAERDAHHLHLVEVLLISAEAMDRMDRPGDANTLLTLALERAAEAGLSRLFAEEGPRLRGCLARLPALKAPGRWHQALREMLAQVANADEAGSSPHASNREQKEAGETIAVPDAASNDALPEPLSQREQEVLALIHQGLANKEIARAMEVAPATVKAHIRNLYGKLAVSRRTEALARARTLGLLER